MADIVERLRLYASDDHERGCQGRCYDCSCGYDAKRDPLLNEAAGTIERLREEIDTWKSVFPDIAPASVMPDRALVEAENERLRAALEKHETRFNHCSEMLEQSFNISGTLRAEYARRAHHYALEARAALGGDNAE